MMAKTPKKILVVEDEESLRKDIIDMLSFEGFEVAGAENGRVGIEKAKDYLPDLIICDIMMPEASGYDVLSELRQETTTAAIPFIFLTARTDKLDRRQGMEQGADDYLTKPFAVTELLRTIETRLTRREVIRKEGERLAEQRNEELRNNIILSMPHELRTPLTVILGFSDILYSDHKEMSRPRIGDMAQHINKAATRLYRLVENYLVYAQIEVAVNDTDYMNLIEASVTANPEEIIEAQAAQKAQEYEREGDLVMDLYDNVETLQIVEDYLKKLAEELVDNAFKFSQPGTPVHVTMRREDDRCILSVTDQGRGMTEDEINKIGAYMQFNRKVYEQQGSGLGLAIGRRITEIHNGDFAIESEPDKQTTVTVKLRFAEQN